MPRVRVRNDRNTDPPSPRDGCINPCSRIVFHLKLPSSSGSSGGESPPCRAREWRRGGRLSRSPCASRTRKRASVPRIRSGRVCIAREFRYWVLVRRAAHRFEPKSQDVRANKAGSRVCVRRSRRRCETDCWGSRCIRESGTLVKTNCGMHLVAVAVFVGIMSASFASTAENRPSLPSPVPSANLPLTPTSKTTQVGLQVVHLYLSRSSLTISRSRVTFAMMLAAAMQYSRPSPPMTHSEFTSARPGGVKFPSTRTNGASFELLLFLVRVFAAFEQTSRAQLYQTQNTRERGRDGGEILAGHRGEWEGASVVFSAESVGVQTRSSGKHLLADLFVGRERLCMYKNNN